MIIKPYIQIPKLSRLKPGDEVTAKGSGKIYTIDSIDLISHRILLKNGFWWSLHLFNINMEE